MNRISRSVVGIGAASLLALTACGDAAQSDPDAYPEQDIEILVGFGPGGGADIFARQVASIVEDDFDARVQVINMEGAGGVNAIREVDNRAADGYTWIVDVSLAALAARGELGDDGHELLKPVARFQDEIVHIMVDPERYSDWDEVAAEADQSEVRVGGVGVGAQADIATMELEAESDLNVTYIPFDGAGELLTALQSGNIDAAAEEIGAWVDQIDSGDVLPVLAFNDERIEGFEEIPTSVEQGYDATTGGTRGIMVHADTDDQIVSEIEGILQHVYDSPEYKEHEEAQFIHLREGWLNHDDYTTSVEEQYDRISTLTGDNET